MPSDAQRIQADLVNSGNRKTIHSHIEHSPFTRNDWFLKMTENIYYFASNAESTIYIDFIGAQIHLSGSGSGGGGGDDNGDSHDPIIALCTDAGRLSKMDIPNVDTVSNGSDGSPSFGQLSIQMYLHQLSDVRVPN